jgi:hypothetical protein
LKERCRSFTVKGLFVTAVFDPVTDLGTDEGAGGDSFTDDELTALALAADPDEPLALDARPLSLYAPRFAGALPTWYMAPVTAGVTRSWRLPVVIIIVASFLLIDAFGLCITYGQLIAA